jgi:hypothetical protein
MCISTVRLNGGHRGAIGDSGCRWSRESERCRTVRAVGIKATSTSCSRRGLEGRGLRADDGHWCHSFCDKLAQQRQAARHADAASRAARQQCGRSTGDAAGRQHAPPTAADSETSTQRSPECCTSQEGAVEVARPSACGAFSREAVALDRGCACVARRAVTGQAVPLSSTSSPPQRHEVGWRRRALSLVGFGES